MALLRQLPPELKIELARYTSRPAWQLVHDELLTMTRVIAEFLEYDDVILTRISARAICHRFGDQVIMLPRWISHTSFPGIRNIYKAREICQRKANLVHDIVA